MDARISYVTLDPQKDGKSFKLCEDVIYQYDSESWKVPAGTSTDFASIPWFGRWLLPKWGRYGWAAILHDFLYSNTGPDYTRKRCDNLFLLFMKLRNTPLWQMFFIYWSVRLFGWMFFKKD